MNEIFRHHHGGGAADDDESNPNLKKKKIEDSTEMVFAVLVFKAFTTTVLLLPKPNRSTHVAYRETPTLLPLI